MKFFARIIHGLAIVAVAAVGVLWMLMGLKEGSSLEELPFTIAGLLATVGLAVVWWLAVGRSLALAGADVAGPRPTGPARGAANALVRRRPRRRPAPRKKRRS